MNAAEKLEAAITKLETLKARATDGPWKVNETWVGDSAAVCNQIGRVAAHYVPVHDAELIVTLHRTIDAQLAILRRGIAVEQVWGPSFGNKETLKAVMALADAILGGD